MAQAQANARVAAKRSAVQPHVTWGQNLLTVLFSLWLMVGIFIDGWAHTNIPELETFFTPWHAIFYAGYTATALWVVWLARSSGKKGLTAIPKGYGMGAVGLVIFGIGGVADMFWHELLYIETSIPALLSPPHIILLTGASLTLLAPMRAQWLDDNAALDTPTLKQFLPALLSAAVFTSLVAFFLTYMWAFRDFEPHHMGEQYQRGLGAQYITNLIFFLPLFMIMRRWRLPFGSATILFVLPTVLSCFFEAFEDWEAIPMMLVVGLVVDTMVRKAQAPEAKGWELRLLAGLGSAILWTLYHLVIVLKFEEGIQWRVEAWTGSILMTALMTIAVSFLVFPIQLPERLRK